jgi:hypothetical protein
MPRLAFGILLGLVVLLGVADCLDPTEVTALDSILLAFPSLAQVNPFDQYDDQDNDWGGSWTKPTSEICDDSDGWDVHGIYCSGNHVTGIRFTASFGVLNTQIPSQISGLGWLRNYTLAPLRSSKFVDPLGAHDFLGAILRLPSLRSVLIPQWQTSIPFPSSDFESANLTHVALILPSGVNLQFSNMSYLEEFNLQQPQAPDFTQFAFSANTLRSLIIRSSAASPDGLSELLALENLELTFNGIPNPAWSPFLIPPNLKTLMMVSWVHGDVIIGNASSVLESLTIIASSSARMAYWPPSLKKLVLNNIHTITWTVPPSSYATLRHFESVSNDPSGTPPWLGECPLLQTLILQPDSGTNNLNVLYSNFMNTSLLETLTIGSASWPLEGEIDLAHEWLCSVPSSLKQLTIRAAGFTSYPACVSQFTNLEILDLNSPLTLLSRTDIFHLANFSNSVKQLTTTIGTIGHEATNSSVIYWQQLVEHFTNLNTLWVTQSNPVRSTFPGDHIKTLAQLRVLNLSSLNLTGTIPSDFFDSLPNLDSCYLSFNQLSGTIPTYGWGSTLRLMRLENNLFSDWPSLSPPGAPLLRNLLLSNNRLKSIPSDAVFSEMTSLRVLRIDNNPLLSSKLPVFWTSGTHRLATFNVISCGFTGTIPPIRTPYLRSLQLSGNSLCGSLPEAAAPVALNTASFSNNKFSGSIPVSWSQNMTASYLMLDSNQLNGTIPDQFISPYSSYVLNFLTLSNNYFTGPFPNLAPLPNLGSINSGGTNNTWDFCARSSMVIPLTTACTIELHPSICACSSIYETCLDIEAGTSPEVYCQASPDAQPSEFTPTPIGPRVAVSPPVGQCVVPPTSPQSEVEDCPPPSPGPSFYCDQGNWKSTGSVTQPTLTIPGSVQPGQTSIVVVEGNLTVTDGGIAFNGFNGQVVVNGCVFLGDNQVTIELTKEEIEELAKEGSIPKTLLSTLIENSCIGSSDLSQTKVVATKGSGSKACRKVKAQNSGSSTKSSLQVIFKIDNSTCNMIIIIPSVIGGIIILAAIALIIGLYLRHLKFSTRKHL